MSVSIVCGFTDRPLPDLRSDQSISSFAVSPLSPVPQDASLDRSQPWSTQHILICCVCLGDNSEDADEIIQCDNCGVTVHEGKTRKTTY